MEEGLVGEMQAAKTVCPTKRTGCIKGEGERDSTDNFTLCIARNHFVFVFIFAVPSNLLDTTCQIISNTSLIIVLTIVSVKN